MDKINNLLKNISKKLTSLENVLKDIHKEQKRNNTIQNAKYPSLNILEHLTIYKNCRENKSCSSCSILVRNKCWKEVLKKRHQEKLIQSLPLSKTQLFELKQSDLMFLLSHLGINAFEIKPRTKSNLVSKILNTLNQ